MAARHSTRSDLYMLAREMGTAKAISKGPGAYAKRVARRKVYRTTNRLTGKLIRSVGLF